MQVIGSGISIILNIPDIATDIPMVGSHFEVCIDYWMVPISTTIFKMVNELSSGMSKHDVLAKGEPTTPSYL